MKTRSKRKRAQAVARMERQQVEMRRLTARLEDALRIINHYRNSRCRNCKREWGDHLAVTEACLFEAGTRYHPEHY